MICVLFCHIIIIGAKGSKKIINDTTNKDIMTKKGVAGTATPLFKIGVNGYSQPGFCFNPTPFSGSQGLSSITSNGKG